MHTDGKDIFEYMATKIRTWFGPQTETARIENLFMYYRAQSIISRKVVKELEAIDKSSAEHIFSADALTHVLELYSTFRLQSEKKMNDLMAAHASICNELAERLALFGVHKIEEETLHELYERQLITPKLYITLKEEMQ